MKRFVPVLAFSLVATIASTSSSFAQQRRPLDGPHAQGPAFALHRLHHCLSLLDLTADQKDAIEAIFSGAKPNLRTDLESVRVARQKVEADLAARADKCVIGADVLSQHANSEKLRADIAAVREQVLAKLGPDQQSRLEGCFQDRRHPR